MPTSVLYSDVHVAGQLTCLTFVPPTSSIPGTSIDPASPIGSSRLEQQYAPAHRQTGNVAAATDEVHEAYAAGTITAFRAKIRTAPSGGDSYTIDLKVNGTSILASPITVTSATTVNSVLTAAIATPAYVAGNRIEVVVASVSGSNWGTGLFAGPILREASGP